MSNRYEITSLLEKDTLGEVFLAYDVTLERKVVYRNFKIAGGQELGEKFNEYKGKLCALQHPHLLTIYDIGFEDDACFMVTQFIEAESMSERLPLGQVTQEEVYNMASDLLDALHSIHDAGLEYGALNPKSVSRKSRIRGGHRYFIVDLGLEKVKEMLDPSYQPAIDTEFLAPEVLGGAESDERSEMFALGQLCYGALLGNNPFSGLSKEQMVEFYKTSEIPDIQGILPQLNAEFSSWLMSLLSFDPAGRPSSIEEAMNQLQAIPMSAPLPDLSELTQAVSVAASPATQVQSTEVNTVSTQTKPQEVANQEGKTKSKISKKWRWIIGGGILLLLLTTEYMMKMRDASDGSANGDANSSLKISKFLVHFKGEEKKLELETSKTLDWIVVTGSPSSSDRVNRKGHVRYITSVNPIGDFLEIEEENPSLQFMEKGNVISPKTKSFTNDNQGNAQSGDGWEILLKISRRHAGAINVILYMLQDRCDFDISVKGGNEKEVKIQSSYKEIGKHAGFVKIPIPISNPAPGAFYTIKIVVKPVNDSGSFSAGLAGVQVLKAE